KSSKIVGAIQSYLRVGALTVAIGNHKDMASLGFDIHASIYDPATDRRRARYDYGSQKNATTSKILLHFLDSLDLQVAQGVCYRWKIPYQVANFEIPVFGKVFGYSILGSQNSPIA